MKIRLKRAYVPPDNQDGVRLLVERLWPRGQTKGKTRIDEWFKDVAPSQGLRKGYGHDPEKWEELRRNPDAVDRLR